jgi:hypothetical protein
MARKFTYSAERQFATNPDRKKYVQSNYIRSAPGGRVSDASTSDGRIHSRRGCLYLLAEWKYASAMKNQICSFLAITSLLLFAIPPAHAQPPGTDWRIKLNQELPLLGHRNWIMIVDSAYPLQTSPGVETIETNDDLPRVARIVLDALDHSIHVTPNIYLDAELPYVTDQAAPGVSVYRQHLKEILNGRPARSLPHETLIKQVNDAGQAFHILVLKTNMAIPYTSIFLQLDCKYWPPQAEQQLRQAMGGISR